MKIAGIVLLFLACALAGAAKSRSLSARLHELEGLSGLVGRVSEEIAYLRTPLYELLKRTAQSQAFAGYSVVAEYGRRLEGCADAAAAWDGLERHGPLTDADFEIVDDLMHTLGHTDAAGQQGVCADALSRLARASEAARADSRARGRLYRTLGLLAGAGLAVILI